MWDFDKLSMPSYFDVQQVMTIIDGTTFSAYFNNMRQKITDMVFWVMSKNDFPYP